MRKLSNRRFTSSARREPDFRSDKDCGMVRDAALRSAFMSLFTSLCGIERDQCVLTVTKVVTNIIVLKADKRASRYTPLNGACFGRRVERPAVLGTLTVSL